MLRRLCAVHFTGVFRSAFNACNRPLPIRQAVFCKLEICPAQKAVIEAVIAVFEKQTKHCRYLFKNHNSLRRAQTVTPRRFINEPVDKIQCRVQTAPDRGFPLLAFKHTQRAVCSIPDHMFGSLFIHKTADSRLPSSL